MPSQSFFLLGDRGVEIDRFIIKNTRIWNRYASIYSMIVGINELWHNHHNISCILITDLEKGKR
jgi:hypothetical protein